MNSNLSEPACERKPTKPTIFAPEARLPKIAMSPTNSRKLPDLTKTDTSECSVNPSQRNLLLECDLQLSEEDENRPVVNKTIAAGAILINALDRFSKCKHLLVKGGNKGQTCGKKCAKGKDLCSMHLGVYYRKKNPIAEEGGVAGGQGKVEQLTLKVQTLERMILKLMKDKREKSLHQVSTTSGKVKTTLDKATQTERVATPTFDSSSQSVGIATPKKQRSIQKTRIYKLKRDQIYRLLSYKDGMPLLKSKGKLFLVPIPIYMTRPVPNGKWCLVCDPEQPKMVWKEM